MILSRKIRLLPNKEQEIMFFKHINYTRFIYNWGLETWNNLYQNGEKCGSSILSKQLTQLKKIDEFNWLNDVSGSSLVTTLRDLEDSFKRFFNKTSNYPKFKSKKRNTLSYPVRCDKGKLYFKDNYVKIEKIGKVKYKSNLSIPNTKYSNARITFDGKYWILTFGIEVDENQVDLDSDLSLGIDLGIKDLANLSNGKVFKNINKSKKMIKLNKKLNRFQRQLSRKYEMNKQGNKFIKTNNIIKLEKKIKLIHRKLKNIRNNHINHLTSYVVNQKPYRVVIEDLNIKGMMKNKYLAKAIQQQGFYEIRRQLEYKCKFNGISLLIANRFYPSSKLCSCCGNKKNDLKLKDRIYKCDNCGITIDRDFNASINLSNYDINWKKVS